MYNLIVKGLPWEEHSDEFSLDRIFERTTDELVERFKPNGRLDLDALRKLPCLLMDEGKSPDQTAKMCRIIDARIHGSNVNLEYRVEPGFPSFTNKQVHQNASAFGIGHDFDFSRTHWAVKDVDLYYLALKLLQRPSRTGPTVFNVPDREKIEHDLVSVMMPFDGRFDPVYSAIVDMAGSIFMKCRRGDNIWEQDAIIQDVVNLIDRSKIVVCDLTGKNPNVFYETGIAHTLGRSVILITQSRDDIPFDLRHLRYITYLNNEEGRAKLRKELADRINTIIEMEVHGR